MADPTVVGSETPWAGYTRATAVEEILKSRGLTNDTTTGRIVASTEQSADALLYLKMALDEFHNLFPGVFSIRTLSTTWVSGDTMLALPVNVGSVLTVRYNGVDVYPYSRDDLEKTRRPTDQGGGVETSDAGKPLGYRVVGFASEASAGAGHQQVLRLYPTPSGTFAAQGLEVDYVALSPALSTSTQTLPVWPKVHGWLIERAKELWCASRRDAKGIAMAAAQKQVHWAALDTWVQGSREIPNRVSWRRPNPHSKRHTRYGK